MSFNVLRGDALEQLSTLRANSFDGCLTDPPYGLSFMGKAWDKSVPSAEVWREVLRVLKPGAFMLAFGGTRTYHRLTCAIEDAGFEIRDCLMWLYGSGFPKGKGQLKPAWEPIILARKRAKATVLNIDACRIGTEPRLNQPMGRPEKCYGGYAATATATATNGRWPANLLLDEHSAELLDAQSGVSKSKSGGKSGVNPGMWAGKKQVDRGGHNDSGGASRFFYVAKASTRERYAGLDGWPLSGKSQKYGSIRANRGNGYDEASRTRNAHPTVKPVTLNEYLARLILPPERKSARRILVPFSGSGSEIAGALKAGWDDATGIELNPEYIRIAKRRIPALAS